MMKISVAKKRFIEHWGRMGPEWGINRCMAQIHALLLIAPEPLCSETIMEELFISRGSVNTNLRALIDWGLIKKKLIPGERREFFIGEKDMWTVFKRIVENRQKKELKPLLSELAELKEVEGNSGEVTEFTEILDNLIKVTSRVDSTLDLLLKMDEAWLEEGVFSTLG